MTRPVAFAGQRFALLAVIALIGGCGGSGPVLPSAAVPSTSAGPAAAASPSPAPTSMPGPSPTASQPAETCFGASAGQSSTFEVTVGAGKRGGLVHVPRSSSAGSVQRPVVLMFHGYSDASKAAEDMSGLSTKADAAGFVAIYPQAIGAPARWDVGGAIDTTFVGALLARLAAEPCVDPARIYAVGMSMGGGMANMVACRLADRIAGLATVAGVYGPKWGDPCNAKRAVPVIAFHGLVDPQVPYAGGPIADPEMGVGGNPDLPAVIGVEAWAADWATRNGCGASAEPQAAIGKVEPLLWAGCAAPVELYRVTDGGHTWPGSSWDEPLTNRDVSATDIIWDFLSRFSLAGG